MIHIMIDLDHHVVFATDRNVHTDLKLKAHCLWPNVLSYASFAANVFLLFAYSLNVLLLKFF